MGVPWRSEVWCAIGWRFKSFLGLFFPPSLFPSFPPPGSIPAQTPFFFFFFLRYDLISPRPSSRFKACSSFCFPSRRRMCLRGRIAVAPVKFRARGSLVRPAYDRSLCPFFSGTQVRFCGELFFFSLLDFKSWHGFNP